MRKTNYINHLTHIDFRICRVFRINIWYKFIFRIPIPYFGGVKGAKINTAGNPNLSNLILQLARNVTR